MCNGCARTISSALYYSEKLVACFAVVVTTCCLISTIIIVLALGIGLGYNFCYVDMRTRRRYIPQRYNYIGSPRKKGFDPAYADLFRRGMANGSDNFPSIENTTNHLSITDATLPQLGGHARISRFTFLSGNNTPINKATRTSYLTPTPSKMFVPTSTTWSTSDENFTTPGLALSDIYKSMSDLTASLDHLKKLWNSYPVSPPQSKKEENNLTEWRKTYLSRLERVKNDEDNVAKWWKILPSHLPKIKKEDDVKLWKNVLSHFPSQIMEKEENITKWWKNFPSHLPQVIEKENNSKWWKSFSPQQLSLSEEDLKASRLPQEPQQKNDEIKWWENHQPKLKDADWWKTFLSQLPLVIEKEDNITKRGESVPQTQLKGKDDSSWWKTPMPLHLQREIAKEDNISQWVKTFPPYEPHIKEEMDNATKWWKSFLLRIPEVEKKDNETKWWKSFGSNLPQIEKGEDNSKDERDGAPKWWKSFMSQVPQVKDNEENATKWWKTFLSRLPEVVEEKKHNATKWWKSFLAQLPQVKDYEEDSTKEQKRILPSKPDVDEQNENSKKWWKNFLSHLPHVKENEEDSTKEQKEFLPSKPDVEQQNENSTKWWKTFGSQDPPVKDVKDNGTKWWKTFLSQVPQEKYNGDNGTRSWKTFLSRLPEKLEEEKRNATQWWKSLVSRSPQEKYNGDNETKWWKTFFSRLPDIIQEEKHNVTKWWKSFLSHMPVLPQVDIEDNGTKWWKLFVSQSDEKPDKKEEKHLTTKRPKTIQYYEPDFIEVDTEKKWWKAITKPVTPVNNYEYENEKSILNKTAWWKTFTTHPPQENEDVNVTKRHKSFPSISAQPEEDQESTKPLILNTRTTIEEVPTLKDYIRFTDIPVENTKKNIQSNATPKRNENLNLDGPLTIPIKGFDLISLLSKLRADDRNFTIQIVTS